MQIRLDSLTRGAAAVQGTVIIVDVFRAFTTAALAFELGASQILLVAQVDEALKLREQGWGDLLIGEVDGKKPDGFDLGNSPFELSQLEPGALAGKRLIQSTRAGTVGVAAAGRAGATEIFLGSFVVAQATVRAVLGHKPGRVSIIAMGTSGVERADEDEQCVLYLRNLLQGRQPDKQAVDRLIRVAGPTLRFLDPLQPQYHREDIDWALDFDRFPFAMRATSQDGRHFIAKPLATGRA